jgi:hypothetical protein
MAGPGSVSVRNRQNCQECQKHAGCQTGCQGDKSQASRVAMPTSDCGCSSWPVSLVLPSVPAPYCFGATSTTGCQAVSSCFDPSRMFRSRSGAFGVQRLPTSCVSLSPLDTALRDSEALLMLSWKVARYIDRCVRTDCCIRGFSSPNHRLNEKHLAHDRPVVEVDRRSGWLGPPRHASTLPESARVASSPGWRKLTKGCIKLSEVV